MNYLAHFHLAWPDEQLVLGGLEGDFHRGPLRGDLPVGLEAGITLHRAIDAFTDSHAQVAGLRTRFPEPLRRFAGILIDLSFDHCLTLHWSRYSELPLHGFNQRVTRILGTNSALLSTGAAAMAQRIEQYDILSLYQHWDTVPRSAARIGERFARKNPFLDIEDTLLALQPDIERTFLDFYPDLIEFSRQYRL
jgi:acyl carrier protein phosphodiesterase